MPPLAKRGSAPPPELPLAPPVLIPLVHLRLLPPDLTVMTIMTPLASMPLVISPLAITPFLSVLFVRRLSPPHRQIIPPFALLV